MAREVVGDLVTVMPLLRALVDRFDQVRAASTASPLPPLDAALIAVLSAGDPCHPADLAHMTGFSRTRVETALSHLAAAGVVRARGDRWRLSPAGRIEALRASELDRCLLVPALQDLDSNERRALVRGLIRMAEALR